MVKPRIDKSANLRVTDFNLQSSSTQIAAPFGKTATQLLVTINYTVSADVSLPPGDDPLGMGSSQNMANIEITVHTNPPSTGQRVVFSRKNWGPAATTNNAGLELTLMAPPAALSGLNYSARVQLISKQPGVTYQSDPATFSGTLVIK